MLVQIAKWGNSQGIRLPKTLLDMAGIKPDDELELTAERGRITITPLRAHRTLEERAAAFGGKLGPYEEYDWGEPQGREVL